ncbi:tyrosine-protein kinase [Prevotella mizrahii]|uniref:non-specific protein-tyrosine kinase n=1 Tax=Hallella mizrahii TaxID=2606637 RepID=A0A7K0KEA0_9BACT|nr:polysaccharide biosynthesis tyrosine autokinase [Hallella mizrahii]
MEQNLNTETELENQQQQMPQPEGAGNAINFATIFTAVVLNWKWFVLSIVICLGLAAVYLRYATPIYQVSAKLLIKDNDQNSPNSANKNAMLNSATLGLISNSNGFDNEMEILTSHSLALQVVKDMKIYVDYYFVGKVKDELLYRQQPINVDMDEAHLNKLNMPVQLKITREDNSYKISGTCYVPVDKLASKGPFKFERTVQSIPSTIYTRVGAIQLTQSPYAVMKDGESIKVFIYSPQMAANKYVEELSATQTSKTTTIAQLTLNDEDPQRALDYVQRLSVCYNQQANVDKNEIARRTEQFINGRLEKINAELGNTEGQLESYKRRNNVVELKTNATGAYTNATEYQQKLSEANTQVALISEMQIYMNNPKNHFQPLPSNVGLDDQASTALISNYNELLQKRSLLLQSASENSPSVIPLTSQISEMERAIRRALVQARKNLEIQRNALAVEYGKYQGQVGETPEQERMLTQIGRQQEVKSGLYLMLLQKREENSISLAATADKGKLIDGPSLGKKVSPKSSIILLVALMLALAIPSLILFLLEFFRYKIEGHEDVAKLTTLPIIADIAVSSETAKTKGEIVVHENKNNQMEEIFRSMRTNIQFMLEKDEKVIMFTSSTSGEGKTFVASNLAMSFALLGKRVLLVGLDIRKPRLANLFEIDDFVHGITNLLVKESPTWDDVEKQLLPSGVNKNLTLLMAGPTPPNPAELVTRKSLGITFDLLRQHFDYIIVDTAPVGLVTDTLQIAKVCDTTVYVCRADYTPKENFEMINGLAFSKKMPKMSIVVNGIDMSKKKNGYYYGYGKYGKYGRYARNLRSSAYGSYGSYGSYGHYGHYGSYGSYGNYGNYGSYGNYKDSHYSNEKDDSIKQ